MKKKTNIINTMLTTINTKVNINGMKASAKFIKGIIENIYDNKTTPRIAKDKTLCSKFVELYGVCLEEEFAVLTTLL